MDLLNILITDFPAAINTLLLNPCDSIENLDNDRTKTISKI